MILTEINIYPIKSLGGISLQTSEIEARGLKYDRRWMLVDEENNFITQRKFNRLALLKLSLSETGLIVNETGSLFNLKINFGQTINNSFNVIVWSSLCPAIEVSHEANQYFSDFLKIKCKLVYMPDSSERLVDETYAFNKEIVSFADGFPILIIGQSSLDDLNAKLVVPVSMNRFRPNFVVNTSAPFYEDTWDTFSIGTSVFQAVKPCARCIMTTIDQETAQKSSEPMKTLAGYRSINNKVMFGQNLLFKDGDTTITLDNEVKIISVKSGFFSRPLYLFL